MCRGAATGAIALSFGMPGDIADIITHAKFYVNRLGGFGVLTPSILPFSIGLACSSCRLQQCKHYRATLWCVCVCVWLCACVYGELFKCLYVWLCMYTMHVCIYACVRACLITWDFTSANQNCTCLLVVRSAVLRVETEREKEVIQQLKQATDTAARLQDELRQAVDREQRLQRQLDEMKLEMKYHDSKMTCSDIYLSNSLDLYM